MTVTSGGIVWRRQPGGGVEVCLLERSGGYSIPRGVVLEDERLPDAAARQVFSCTGISGRTQCPLTRLDLGPEIAHLYLLRLSGTRHKTRGADTAWVALDEAVGAVASEGERRALTRAKEELT